jgi:hypothetical protein
LLSLCHQVNQKTTTMKKVIVSVALFVFAFAANVTAQISAGKQDPAKLEVTMQDVLISSITLREGSNTIPVPDGRGTIKLVKRGDKFSDVVYTDAAGKAIRLAPNNGATGNLPKTPCKMQLACCCLPFKKHGSINTDHHLSKIIKQRS